MRKNAKNTLLKLSKKKLNIMDTITLYMILIKQPYGDITLAKLFLDHYYDTTMPTEFYKMFMVQIQSHQYKEVMDVLLTRNIYDLINFLKGNENHLSDDSIHPSDYFELPQKQVRLVVEKLKELPPVNDSIRVKKAIINTSEWKLRRRAHHTEEEMTSLAYKLLSSIGLDNTMELLSSKYGEIDYQIIYYLFHNLNGKDSKSKEVFQEFLFSNKKDQMNTMRLILSGEFNECLINFDYFYNSIEFFIEKLGTKLNKSKVALLLKERYLSSELEYPELSGDILQDMIASYNHKYDISEKDSKILEMNIQSYQEKLKTKTKSSIKKTSLPKVGDYSFEMIPLKDPRNLVMGYRAGNCFRLNGDAFILFDRFLTNPHMRLLSISTEDYKDFGMVLLMRNGNVLIAQGIETSKRVPNTILGRKLYEAVKQVIEEITNQDNSLIGSVIGLSNQNTQPYNHNYLPFIINPILSDNHQYYNGIDCYQGLLSLKEGKSIQDIKLYIPDTLYSDESNQIYRRERRDGNDYIYREIEKRLIALRFQKFKQVSRAEMIYYYSEISGKREAYTTCSTDWFITVFQDGTIDSFINSEDTETQKEFKEHLEKAKEYCKK